RLEQCRGTGYLLTEGESKHIGKVVVPERFHLAMLQQTSIWVSAPLEYRIQVILDAYPTHDDLTAAFEPPIQALKDRLGKQVVGELLGLLADKEWSALIRRLLVDYYDPLYMHSRSQNRIDICIENLDDGVNKLKQAIAQLLPAQVPGYMRS
ncbi:MAG: Rhodanese-like protein, partial [uncultured bacterium]